MASRKLWQEPLAFDGLTAGKGLGDPCAEGAAGCTPHKDFRWNMQFRVHVCGHDVVVAAVTPNEKPEQRRADVGYLARRVRADLDAESWSSLLSSMLSSLSECSAAKVDKWTLPSVHTTTGMGRW